MLQDKNSSALCDFLRAAVCDLDELININNLDIADIKVANHDAIFERLESKNNLISAFEAHKSQADSEMVKLTKRFPNKNIQELLDDEAMELIDSMRTNLKTLRALNKSYAKSVVAVQEFYSSLLDSIIPGNKGGYYNTGAANVDLLRIEA